jgi:hypothetical protein
MCDACILCQSIVIVKPWPSIASGQAMRSSSVDADDQSGGEAPRRSPHWMRR